MTQRNQDAEESNDIQLKSVSSENEHARLCEFFEISKHIDELWTIWMDPTSTAPIEQPEGDYLFTEKDGAITSGALVQYENKQLNSDEARIQLFATHIVYSSEEGIDRIFKQIGGAVRSNGKSKLTAVLPKGKEAKEPWLRHGFDTHQNLSKVNTVITGV